jgi:nucleoside-diphosphate-sugar epimerase
VFGATRGAARPIAGALSCPVGDIGPRTDWAAHLEGVDVVVHLATSAHRPISSATGEREGEATATLVRAAAAARVRRLVHISSIRAMGEATAPGRPFRVDDRPCPRDAYGRIKFAIEATAVAAARNSGLDLVILRPPLVYGPGVKGNFRALLRLVANRVPLPFSLVDNRRSLIFIDNLVDLIALACTHTAAVGRVLLARDDAELSIAELIGALAQGLGGRACLFPVPTALLDALRSVPMLRHALRLTLSLQVDDVETRHILGWSPTITAEAGLAATARAFRGARSAG